MCSSMMQIVALSALVVCLSSTSSEAKTTVKRGVGDFGLSSFGGGFNGISHDISFGFPGALSPQPVPIFVKTGPSSYGSGLTLQKSLPPYSPPVSSSDIASALHAAQEASSRVNYLQSRVQAAKDALVESQQLARAKEQAAALALQRSEAAAAVQRRAASAAASAVVRAQEQLAHAKSEVAEQQRVAAAKEQIAAHVIQKSASAAAAEIQRTEDTAAKIAALQRSEAQAAIQHITAAKDASLSAAASAVSANANANVHSNGNGNGNGHGYQGPPKYHPWN